MATFSIKVLGWCTSLVKGRLSSAGQPPHMVAVTIHFFKVVLAKGALQAMTPTSGCNAGRFRDTQCARAGRHALNGLLMSKQAGCCRQGSRRAWWQCQRTSLAWSCRKGAVQANNDASRAVLGALS